MRNLYLTIIMLLSIIGAHAATPQKQTHLFAVKGTDSLYLDHYVSPVVGERGCMMFVFGGGFVAGTRDDELYLPYFEFLTKNGYDVISIDYRLGLKALKGMSNPSNKDMIVLLNNSVNMAVEDLFSATLFVLDNAKEWQIDTKRIVTSGSSAGAITVLQAENAICNRTPSSAVLPSGFRYAGVISYAGAIFTLNGAPKWAIDPAPIMFFHGSADRRVPYDKATMLGIGFYGPKSLYKVFDKQAWPYWFYDVEYQSHAMAGLPMHENHNEILTFLTEFVQKQRPLTIHTLVRDGKIPECETKFKVKDYLEANYSR